VVDVSGDATCLLGLDGLAVECVVLTGAGVRIVRLVTSDPDAARCPACRVVSSSGKEWVLTRPRDLPSGGAAVLLQWRKRRWRCRTEDCPRQTFTEQVRQVPAGMRTTTRLREGLARAVRGRAQSVRGRYRPRGVVAHSAASASGLRRA
jgi:transposase